MGWRWQQVSEGSGENPSPQMGWVWVEGVPSQGYYTGGGESGDAIYTPPPGDASGKFAYNQGSSASENSSGGEGAGYYDTGSGLIAPDQNAAAAQHVKQLDDEFLAVWRDPNASMWDKALAVQKRYGIEGLAQAAASGAFPAEFAQELGPHIAARQREAEAEGFSIGGNQLKLWPVALGTAAFAGLAAAGVGATEGGAATVATEGTAAGSAAATEAGAAGAFDSFGSLGTGLEAGVGGAGYVPAEAAAYAAQTGGSVFTISEASDAFMNDLFSDFGSTQVETGVTTSPERMLMADSGLSTTDVTPGLVGESTGSMPSAVLDAGGGTFETTALPGGGTESSLVSSPPPQSSLLNSAVTWGKENPILAIGAMQLGGNVLKGMSDAKTTDKKLAQERELVERRQQQAQELQEWKRAFSNAGAFTGRVAMRPSGAPLRRTDGTPVFTSSGLLASTVR